MIAAPVTWPHLATWKRPQWPLSSPLAVHSMDFTAAP